MLVNACHHFPISSSHRDKLQGILEALGITNKTRRQPITTTLGKLYVVALFISHTHQGHSLTHLSFCTLHDS